MIYHVHVYIADFTSWTNVQTIICANVFAGDTYMGIPTQMQIKIPANFPSKWKRELKFLWNYTRLQYLRYMYIKMFAG